MSGLVLASASETRRRMLEAAGVTFTVAPAGVDEAAVKESLRAEGAHARVIAETLAELKAVRISERHPEALVLGADQTLQLGSETLDKPRDLTEAAAQLRRLSGGVHVLPTAAVIAERGRPVWRKLSAPKVAFRSLSETFISGYLANMGERALQMVGGCEVEGRGAQMITRIEGDFFAVLGLPLFELLDYLRVRGILAT